jgi:hypothetical protein
MTALTEWESFYVIVGSSAGALIGLQFVVITLIAEMPVVRDVERASAAFATPTIIHFASVLLLSGIVSAPWHEVGTAAVLWGVLGLCGVAYVVIVVRRMRRQTAYKPEFEDRLFHGLLPFASHATLFVSAVVARSNARGALFAVGASAMLLLFIGVHNAWDGITYHVFLKSRDKAQD